MAVDLLAQTIRYHVVLNAFDLDSAASMFTDQAEYHSSGVGALYARHAILAALRRYFAEYSDQQASDERLAHAGPLMVRVHWRLTATSAVNGQKSIRRGVETIFFDTAGLIRRIEVEDRR